MIYSLGMVHLYVNKIHFTLLQLFICIYLRNSKPILNNRQPTKHTCPHIRKKQGEYPLGLWALPIVPNSEQLRNTTSREVNLFPSSAEGREAPIPFVPLGRANINQNKETSSVAPSPQANYTDWATATFRRNLVPSFVDRGVSRGHRGGSPTVVNLNFLDRSRYFFFQVAPHLSLQGLSGPSSRLTATQKIW
jgi:hypothetical protein